MKLTKEEAVRLFHEQWSDMQKELGDCPSPYSRALFKRIWCDRHFPKENIEDDCFLCEYARQYDHKCSNCPIKWSSDNCCVHREYGGVHFLYNRISEILALPVREEAANGEQ